MRKPLTLYIVDLESIETRYTRQWKTHLPNLFTSLGYDVRVITGRTDIPPMTTEGAFLNFGGTNIYKADQLAKIAELFCSNKIKAGDHFLFTDAWNPSIVSLKYMSELLNIPVKTHAFWQAGSYDHQDFLGRLIGNKKWIRHAEKSFYNCYDYNYFATDFHLSMFNSVLLNNTNTQRSIRTGFPYEYCETDLKPYSNLPKKNLILFPHRKAPEKQLDIFLHLKQMLPHYEFIVCQDQNLTKHEYHTLLGQSKMVFSANLQETLGICCYEALCANSFPLVPDRLSYKEMYSDDYKYPTEWTESFDSYIANQKFLVSLIEKIMNSDHKTLELEQKKLKERFFSFNHQL